MADFVQTMKDWNRMCKSMVQEDEYTGCDKCDLRSFGCPAIYEKECDDANWNHIESVVTKWAAENPEPVYPTLAQWLRSVGLADHRMIDPIPADIAQKLGIEPKEE